MKRIGVLAFAFLAVTFSACDSSHSLAGSSTGGAESANPASALQAGSAPTQTDTGGQTEAAEQRAEIKAAVSKNCNYVYHMLSVSGCGYDNAYGSRYRSLHPEADLQTLKKHEQLLPVAGGKHEGDLYFLCVILPAAMDDDTSVSAYYKALADVFATGELERCFEAYQAIYEQAFSPYTAEVNLESFRAFYADKEALKTEIAEIANVMYRNYDIYMDKVWETSQAELSVAAQALNKEFAENDYVGKWEEALDTQYKQDVFLALLCNSMENGAQAINISDTKDVFCYTTGEYASTAKFISHEFGIYLLFDVLADTPAFQSYSTYEHTEALAEYYNIVISGGYPGNWNDTYIDFYKQLKTNEPEISAKEMFLRAVERLSP